MLIVGPQLRRATLHPPTVQLATDGRPQEQAPPLSIPRHVAVHAAIVGYVFGESFTEPAIAELKVSEDENLVYIRKVGAVGFDGIESLDDLRENWNRLLDAADLTPEERTEAVRLFVANVVSL